MSGNDALLHVVRAFTNLSVPHPNGSIDPRRDYDALETKLILSDMAVIEKRLERLRKERTRSEQPLELPLMERLYAHLEDQEPLRSADLTNEEEKLLRSYSLLSLKPMVVVLNVNDDANATKLSNSWQSIWARRSCCSSAASWRWNWPRWRRRMPPSFSGRIRLERARAGACHPRQL